MAKKHQIVISSKSGRKAAGKSWRADSKESLNQQVSQKGYLDEAKRIAKNDRYSRNLAVRNSQRNSVRSELSKSEEVQLRPKATPANTLVGELAVYAKNMGGKPKLSFALIKEWFKNGDAIYQTWQGNHWRIMRATANNLLVPTGEERSKFLESTQHSIATNITADEETRKH